MKRLLFLLVFLSGCEGTCVNAEDCRVLCGDRGVMVFRPGSQGECICNQVKP